MTRAIRPDAGSASSLVPVVSVFLLRACRHMLSARSPVLEEASGGCEVICAGGGGTEKEREGVRERERERATAYRTGIRRCFGCRLVGIRVAASDASGQ